MNVVLINKSDFTGGAAVFTYRLMLALRGEGIDARMLVCDKTTDSPFVHMAASKLKIKYAFLAERLKIYLSRGVNRGNLFKIDTASSGVPLHKNPYVRKADIICLNWTNQGMLSIKGLKKLIALGKPIVWTMHDMWCFTGICHHAGSCRRFEGECGQCPLLGKGASATDLSNQTWLKKKETYRNISFVAVSNWLAALARKSSLLCEAPVTVIPNSIPIQSPGNGERRSVSPVFNILFGAARIDDPVKGLPILIKATQILKDKYPEESKKLHLTTFGTIKREGAADGIAIPHTHLGHLHGEQTIREAYLNADAILSTSHYESFGGTLIEGQVNGCIPIAFDRGGQSDIINHEETGYLAQWDDNPDIAASNIARGIIWAMKQNQKDISEKMASSAMQRFDAPVVAKKYIKLFHNLL